jgi:serine/threonine protein kinase
MKSGDVLGPFTVVAKLGEGGMGEVYRATDSRLKREVALKVLPDRVAADSDRLARFQREAEVLASLNHPNIAHVHGLEESSGATALVMELVEGDDLAQQLTMRGAIPVSDAPADRATESRPRSRPRTIAASSIATLKPANIKVRPDGTVKVLDFGLAKSLEASTASRHGDGDFVGGSRHRHARVHESGAGARRSHGPRIGHLGVRPRVLTKCSRVCRHFRRPALRTRWYKC